MFLLFSNATNIEPNKTLARSPKCIDAFAKIDQRMHDTLYMCIYLSGLEAFAAQDPPRGWARAHAAKAPSPPEYIHMNTVSCMCWPISANAPVHFVECACPFYRMRLSVLANVLGYSGIQAFQVFRCSGIRVFRSSSIQAFRYSGMQVLRYPGILVFSYSGIQVFRYSDIQVFRYSRIQVF